ncbi:MAG: proton-conducting transporter membrane subunit, partial [Planctomycetota bacterium]
MVRHLPVLIVVVPLLGGILAIFSGGGRKPWMWASAVSAAVAAISAALLAAVLAAPEKVLSYAIGSWPAPWGIEYRVDPLGACVLLVVSVIAAVVTFYSRRSVSDEIPGDRQNFFYSLWLLAVTGLLGITVTGDAFNVYVLLEISSLTIYALVAMGKDRDRRALPAAINYLILGSIGASFILLGIGYLYMVTGTLNMMDMRERLVAMQDSRTVIAGFAFIMVGLYMKMALFPLHVWLPNAYTYAPSAVRALLAATATKVGIYMAFRFTYTIFGIDFSFVRAPNSVIFIACAGLAIIFGSSCAIRQTNLARLLAYSSVAQIGYIVAGLALVNVDGVSGAVLHIMNH